MFKRDHDQEEANKTYAGMIVDLFKKYTTEKIKFFQGGSRRFGWVTQYSDWDYFVYIHPDIRIIVLKALSMFGIKVSTTNPYSHSGKLYVNESESIHVCIFNDQSDWIKSKEEHDNLEKWLSDKPELIEYAKQLKYLGCKGTLMYQAMTGHMNDYNPEKRFKDDLPF